MGIFIEPLFGKEEPVGIVFVCYSRKDTDEVKNIIRQNFTYRGIPYFLDEKDIAGGEESVEKIEKALETVSCAVVFLSPNSMKSEWVWFEIGVLVGKGKCIIPFLINVDDVNSFIKNLPDFIRKYQATWEIDKLIEAVQNHIRVFGNLFDDTRLTSNITVKLKQAKVTITLRLPEDLRDLLKFGYSLVRFGRESVLEHPANIMLREEGKIINKVFYAKTVGYDKKKALIKCEYLIPVHKTLGVKFKPFVDVSDISKIGDIILILKDNGFLDVNRSGSAERQRIYFLLPLEEGNIDKSSEGILDNYLYPI